jgi:hypothetical protein
MKDNNKKQAGITSEKAGKNLSDAFIKAMGGHRFWEREETLLAMKLKVHEQKKQFLSYD